MRDTDTHTTDPDALLREEPAAEHLGVTPRCLQSWRTRGVGPPYVALTPRAVRYRRRDLDAYVEARLVRSTAEARERDPGDGRPAA